MASVGPAAPARHSHPAQPILKHAPGSAGGLSACATLADMVWNARWQRRADAAGRWREPMKKVHDGTASALDGVLFDGMTIMCGGFGLSGNPETLIAALREHGVRDLTVISNNCGADGLGLWHAAGERPDPEDDQLLCRREQAVRAALPLRRAGAGAQPAGHPGRAHPRRRRRHPGLLHADRRRHRGRRGQAESEDVRRRDLCPRDAG